MLSSKLERRNRIFWSIFLNFPKHFLKFCRAQSSRFDQHFIPRIFSTKFQLFRYFSSGMIQVGKCCWLPCLYDYTNNYLQFKTEGLPRREESYPVRWRVWQTGSKVDTILLHNTVVPIVTIVTISFYNIV